MDFEVTRRKLVGKTIVGADRKDLSVNQVKAIAVARYRFIATFFMPR
jgi:hypothetical protein